MKLIVFYVVLFVGNIIAQNLNEEFKYLGEYAIIKHKLEFYDSKDDWAFFPYPEDTSNNIGPLDKSTNFKFNIKEIFNINDIRIIEIEDLTFIGPFLNFKYLFAVKPKVDDYFIFQKEIKFGEEEDFINFLLQDDRNIDKKKCIELFKLVKHYYEDITFFDDSDKEGFEILSDYGLEGYNKLYRLDGDYCYKSFFKIKESNIVEYYYIKYSFPCNKFVVETKLLYRIKV